MTAKRLIAIVAIVLFTALAWFVLGTAVAVRSGASDSRLTPEVVANWGPVLTQEQPAIFYESPAADRARRDIQPERSDIRVALAYQPKQKGLLWYRTYVVDFEAEYLIKNPTPIAQTIYTVFRFPAAEARYDQFALQFGDKLTEKAPVDGLIRESLQLAAGASVPLKVKYRAAGMNQWTYALTNAKRVRQLHLTMRTDFAEIDVPAGSESPTARAREGAGWKLDWNYADVIGANAVAMAMPAVTNPGAVAGRITFFAPVSLIFFFAVLVIVALQRGTNLHPMNYFFLAAGCFAFQLLFAYLVDLLPLLPSFVIAVAVSLGLVGAYLWRAAGRTFALIAAGAQFAYMVLFSYSFFFEGLTGITITIGAIITLALLMAFTARVDWARTFTPGAMPPPMPVR